MKSKFDRIHASIANIEAAIKYYLKDLENNYSSNKISRNEYLKLMKSLKSIYSTVDSLKFENPFEDVGINAIRVLNLSVMSLYEDGDYNTIVNETMKTNSYLCNDSKEEDRKKLAELKQVYNRLPNFYKYRLSKGEITEDKKLHFRDKGLDNIKFIIEKYLTTKYNFKKIKYESANISEENSLKIAEYTSIIESNEYDTNTKNNYVIIRNYLINYAKAEVIIDALSQIKLLCNRPEFSNIKEVVDNLYTKYQRIYNENKAKYDVLISLLNTSNDKISKEKSTKK